MISISERMKKNYEDRYRTKLPLKVPAIIRLDGKSFHTLTKEFEKPFSYSFQEAMKKTALFLKDNIQGCKMAYTFSDEISLLLVDFDRVETCAWFDYNTNKMNSISAAMASVEFNSQIYTKDSKAYFDARSFSVPREEVTNYFLSRQLDCYRSFILGIAQTYFPEHVLFRKGLRGLIDLISEHPEASNMLKEWEYSIYGSMYSKNGQILLDNHGPYNKLPYYKYIEDLMSL